MRETVLQKLQAKADALRQRDVADQARNVSPAQRAAQVLPIIGRPARAGVAL